MHTVPKTRNRALSLLMNAFSSGDIFISTRSTPGVNLGMEGQIPRDLHLTVHFPEPAGDSVSQCRKEFCY
jgi:hypothetical protein